MKSKKKSDPFEFGTKWGTKWESNNLDHLQILWVGKYKNRKVYYLIASVEGSTKNEFEFSKDWSYNTDWTNEECDVDEFAALTHVMNQIRKDYPYLYLLSIRNDPISDFFYTEWEHEVKEFNGEGFPSIEIINKYGPSCHDGIVEWEQNVKRLVDLGDYGSFYKYAEFIWSHKSIYWITFLFSSNKLDLNEIKRGLESATTIIEYEDRITQFFDICLIMNYMEGWMDILSSNEKLVEKVISPYKIETKIGLFNTKKTRLVKS